MNPFATQQLPCGVVREITSPARSPYYPFLPSNDTFNISYYLVARDGVPKTQKASFFSIAV